MATLKNIADVLVESMQSVLVFTPRLEAAVAPNGIFLFREDETYYFLEGNNKYLFNPFKGDVLPKSDVYCEDRPHLRYTAEFLNSIWLALDYVWIPNPLLNILVSDFLTITLNEEQVWAQSYAKLPVHVMQNYVDLENLIKHYAPGMTGAYYSMLNDIELTKQDFVHDLTKDKTGEKAMLSAASAEALYLASGKDAIGKIIQGFWDHPNIQNALDEVRIVFERVIISLFPTIRLVAERSSQPIYGYDVYHVSILVGNEIAVRTLGDYRILTWEMEK